MTMYYAPLGKGGACIPNIYYRKCSYELISERKNCINCSKLPTIVASLSKVEVRN